MTDRQLQRLRTILSLPTAPFREGAVVAFLHRWAEDCGLAFARDQAGNVLIRLRPGGGGGPTWVFTAHMDHPGFVTTAQRGRSVWAEFRGSVSREYFAGSAVRLLAPAGKVAAVVATARRRPPVGWLHCRLDLDAPADVPPGTVGLWDVPAFRRRGRRLHALACDDLAGVAAVVCALDEIVARRVDADVIGLLTRAEEAGFVGALAACRLDTIPRGALVVGIETSKAQPAAPVGKGAVIRVGDHARTFDPSLTAHLSAVADALTRRRPALQFTRQLMPGGTCESTVYCAFGHQAAALALPLGNYHNMSPRGRIAAEQIDLGDFASLVGLLVALAGKRRTPAQTDDRLRRRLDGIFQQRGRLLSE